MTHIIAFGDSITYGAWDINGGWLQRLRKFLDKKNIEDPDADYMVYNLGVSGDNIENLLERFEFEIKPRLSENEENIIIFDIGLNDSQYLFKEKEFKFSDDEFKSNLQKLLVLAQKFSSKIIFLGIIPVNQKEVDPMPWAPEKSYKNDKIEKFNDIIKSLCKENNLFFVDMLGKFKKMNPEILLEDGAHPNSEGHKKIFEIARDFLLKNRIL